MTTWYERIANSRPPDLVIGPPEAPVRLRWHVIPRNSFLNIYIHQSFRSEDDRALHDHPYANFSYILDGEYIEHTIEAGGVNKTHSIQQRSIHLPTCESSAPHRDHRYYQTLLVLVHHRTPCSGMGLSLPQRMASLARLHPSYRIWTEIRADWQGMC